MQPSATTAPIPRTHPARHVSARPAAQHGAALIVSLLILLVMTLIGVTAMQTTVMEERMAGNLRNSNLAQQAAEAALREAENLIGPLTAATQPTPVSSCATPPCTVWQPDLLTTDFAGQSRTWWTANGIEYGTNLSSNLDMTEAGEPYYVIEELDFVSDSLVIPQAATTNGGTFFYRVTAQGVGGDANAVAVLQSTIAKRY